MYFKKQHLIFVLAISTLCIVTAISNVVAQQLITKQFDKVIFNILNAYNKQDGKTINKFIHPDFGLAILYRRDAADNIDFIKNIDFKYAIPEYLPHSFGFTTYTTMVLYEKLPEYDCSTETWNKPAGIYCDTLLIDTKRSNTAKLEQQFEIRNWSMKDIEKITTIEYSSRKIIAVGKNGGTFICYLSIINEQ